MELDQREYEEQLEAARVHLSIFDWDPNLHPRNPLTGRFRDVDSVRNAVHHAAINGDKDVAEAALESAEKLEAPGGLTAFARDVRDRIREGEDEPYEAMIARGQYGEEGRHPGAISEDDERYREFEATVPDDWREWNGVDKVAFPMGHIVEKSEDGPDTLLNLYDPEGDLLDSAAPSGVDGLAAAYAAWFRGWRPWDKG